jgi:FlaA1/EpsC-like NDP-sugar epimerase
MIALFRSLRIPQSTYRQLVCMAVLTPVFAAVYYLAYWLRFDGDPLAAYLGLFTVTMVMVVPVKCLMFGWFRVYQGWGRHVTFHDLVTLAQATTCSSLVMALADYLFLPYVSIPRSVFLMDWGATLVVVGGLRVLLRTVKEARRHFRPSADCVGVLIVGANDAGESLLRAVRLNTAMAYRVVGFVAETPERVGSCLGGVPVVGTVEQTCGLARQLAAREVLVTAGELSGKQLRQLMEDCRQASLHVRVLPGYDELIRGNVAIQPRPVSIEDLLRREPVRLQMDDIRQWIDGRTVMVTGSAGSIGSEVCRQLLRFSPRRLVLVDQSENGQFFIGREFERLAASTELELCIADISDEPRMRSLLSLHQPEIVFHAAAYKHVPLMESNPGEAVKNTALATWRLANLADELGVRSFVMISTDKAVNPTNVMGACKRVAELYIQSLADLSQCRFVTVRFGNVLDSAGSVVPIFREQVARGGPVTVTDPRMTRYFMTIPEAAQLVLQAGTMGQGGEIFVLDMGEPVRIVDLAADVIRLSGLRVGQDIEIEFVGLRPGEKLYEELLVVGEEHLPTQHPKIMVANSRQHDLAAIRTALQRLSRVTEAPLEVILSELQRIVPEFQPQQAAASPERQAA